MGLFGARRHGIDNFAHRKQNAHLHYLKYIIKPRGIRWENQRPLQSRLSIKSLRVKHTNQQVGKTRLKPTDSETRGTIRDYLHRRDVFE